MRVAIVLVEKSIENETSARVKVEEVRQRRDGGGVDVHGMRHPGQLSGYVMRR